MTEANILQVQVVRRRTLAVTSYDEGDENRFENRAISVSAKYFIQKHLLTLILTIYTYITQDNLTLYRIFLYC